MRTQLLNIVEFAAGAAANAALSVLTFTRSELEDWRTTIPALIADPSAFQRRTLGEYAALLTVDQQTKLLAYLKKGDYRVDSLEVKGQPEAILGLSFGEGPDVNELIAESAAAASSRFPTIDLYVQWELGRLLCQRSLVDRRRVHPINLDCDRDYLTSAEVVEAFKRSSGGAGSPAIHLVCQAWHAPRCLAICAANGVQVIGAAFVDAFSPNDPQKWVRNWLAWVLKEGTK